MTQPPVRVSRASEWEKGPRFKSLPFRSREQWLLTSLAAAQLIANPQLRVSTFLPCNRKYIILNMWWTASS